MSSAATALVFALVVATAGLATGHPDTGGNPASPADHDSCSGTYDWTDAGFVLTQTVGLMDESIIVYIHVPPHGSPASQDPAPLPGVIWIESNGFDGFQKNDFLCDPDGPGGDPSTVHADMPVL